MLSQKELASDDPYVIFLTSSFIPCYNLDDDPIFWRKERERSEMIHRVIKDETLILIIPIPIIPNKTQRPYNAL